MPKENIAVVTMSSDMRINVEGFGDITEDVARELAALNRADQEKLIAGEAEARQTLIARAAGTETHGFKHGRQTGQVDAKVVAHWERRYGSDFWRDKSNRDWFFKRHPECAVRYIPSVFRSAAIPLLPGRAQSRADRLTLSTA